MTEDSTDLFDGLFARRVVPVLVPMPAPKPYSYAVPEGMAVEPGSIVQVPLGPRQVMGVVWDGDDDGGVDPKKLKPITHVFDCPPLAEDMRDFPRLGCRLYASRRPASSPAWRCARRPPSIRSRWSRACGLPTTRPERMTPARERVLAAAADRLCLDAVGACACGRHLARASSTDWRRRACSRPSSCRRRRSSRCPTRIMRASRSKGRRSRRRRIFWTSVERADSAVSLIDGVTGSGKTEVYFEAIAETLRQGKQVLILLPEIALTASFLERFQDRFGVKAGRMAFRPCAAHARKGLAAGGGGAGAGRCRRPLGAVPAVRRSRPDHRRRGA